MVSTTVVGHFMLMLLKLHKLVGTMNCKSSTPLHTSIQHCQRGCSSVNIAYVIRKDLISSSIYTPGCRSVQLLCLLKKHLMMMMLMMMVFEEYITMDVDGAD